VIGQAPPYALLRPTFRFRALASLAGRAPLGGQREVALACFMAARLVASCLPPHPLPAEVRAGRVTAARIWFGSLALPATARIPFTRLVDATGGEPLGALSAALAAVIDVAGTYLDGSSRGELEHLLVELHA
jgi:hypothetical protein